MKHPKWRVASAHVLLDEVLNELETGCDSVRELLPNRDLIVDYEITGSYARGAAQLHSDLDINLAIGSEDKKIESAKLLQSNHEQFREAFQRMREISQELHIRIEFAFEHYSMKDLKIEYQGKFFSKPVYSLKDRKLYNRDPDKPDHTFWKLYFDGWKPKEKPKADGYRQPLPGREYVPDPWEDRVEYWSKRYGKHYQRMGETNDTAWAKGLNL